MTSPLRRNVPNMITLARLCAVPMIVWLILTDRVHAAFWVFVAAGVSDALDGAIAKRFGLSSVIGSFLDPVADKALLVSVYVTLGHEGFLPIWLVILVVFRDGLIVGGALLFETVTHRLTMQPLLISKANTLAQIVLASVVLGAVGLDVDDGGAIMVLVVVVALTTLLSGGAYVITWGRRATEENGQ